jgi:hypothetical protein
MAPKGVARRKGDETVKTTVDLPESIWRAAKIRAMDERKDLRAVIIDALTAHLRTKSKEGDRDAARGHRSTP